MYKSIYQIAIILLLKDFRRIINFKIRLVRKLVRNLKLIDNNNNVSTVPQGYFP